MRYLGHKPSPSHLPIAHDALWGNPQHLCRLLHAEPPEKSEFDDLGFARVDLSQRPCLLGFTSKNAKESICRKRFGVLVRFAFSGMNNAGFALCAIQKSLGSRVGACTTAFPA